MTRRRQSPCDLQLKRLTIIIVFNICSFNFYLSGFKIFAVCRFHYPSLLPPGGVTSGGSRGGAQNAGPPPLFFDQNEVRRAETNFFGDRPPPPPSPHLSEGLDPPLVTPIMAYTGSSARKVYLFQASGIWKGRDFTCWSTQKGGHGNRSFRL